jgi:hypothetical protein
MSALCDGNNPTAPPGYPTPPAPDTSVYGFEMDHLFVTNASPYVVNIKWAELWAISASNQSVMQVLATNEKLSIVNGSLAAGLIGYTGYSALLAGSLVTGPIFAVVAISLVGAFFLGAGLASLLSDDDIIPGSNQNLINTAANVTNYAPINGPTTQANLVLQTDRRIYCNVALEISNEDFTSDPVNVLVDSSKGFIDEWYYLKFVKSNSNTTYNHALHILSSYNMPDFLSPTGELLTGQQSVHFIMSYLGESTGPSS